MNDKPFIQNIKTPLGYYFYDVNTNQIVEVDEKTYKYLENMHSEPDTYIDEILTNLKNRGYLSCKRPKEMLHPESDFLEYHLNENIEQITLQVTQDCNFKCAYCDYTVGGFADNQRQHSSRKMSFEMASAIIDFFVNHSKNQKSVYIGFYGGEPLLEFNLIREVVHYAEKMFEGKELRFAITTNGSLFNNENIDFLSKHNIDIAISVDGTPEIHDKSRKFAKTGEGTYHVIENNLKKIKRISPDLFDKININAVIDPRNGFNELEDFFRNHELFKEKKVINTLIDDEHVIEKATPSNEYIIENNINLFKVYLSLAGIYPDDKISVMSKTNVLASQAKQTRTMLPAIFLPDKMSHGGPCIPGQKRLFVTVNGNFIPCERVSETSEAMCIGNIYDGFDYEKARKILNIAQLTEESCKNCWAIRHCEICARKCDNNGELSAELKASQCRNTKSSVEENFKNFLMFKELKKYAEEYNEKL